MAYNRLSTYRTMWDEDILNGRGFVKYASTTIVRWAHDAIQLNTDGYKTVTTKRKMNQASHQFGLGFGIHQKDHEWFVTFKGQTVPFDGRSITLIR